MLILSIASQAFTMQFHHSDHSNKSQELLDKLLARRISEWNNAPIGKLEQEVQNLLNAGANANYTGALHYAAANGQEVVCRLLLNHGANVNALGKYKGETPLMAAVRHVEICKLFIANGAQVNALNYSKRNALTLAARTYNAKTCELLMENGTEFILSPEHSPLLSIGRHYSLYRAQKDDCLGILAIQMHSTCNAIVNTQKRINNAIVTSLMCLNRMRYDATDTLNRRMLASELYRQFKTLMLPHMGKYLSLKKLLNIRDGMGSRAYDYFKIECLNPDNVDGDKPVINTKKETSNQDDLGRDPDDGWILACSVQ